MRKVLTSAHRHWRLRSASALAAVGAMTVSLGIVLLGATTAQVNADEPCVPQDAWTETIQHAAVTHTEQRMTDPGQPYIAPVEATAGHWEALDWFVWRGGPSATPPDVDATSGWVDATALPNGLPHTPTPETVYNVSENGAGLGSWFKYDGTWVPGTPYVPGQDYIAPTYETVTVVDKAAWTETVFHPAVTCEPIVTIDVCPNIEGDQAEVPEGYELEDGDCVQIAGEETIIPKPKPEKPKPAVSPDNEPTVKGVQAVAPPAAPPTAVAAGLAGDSGTATAQLLGQVLAGLGLVMLIAAGLDAPRRVRGAHQS